MGTTLANPRHERFCQLYAGECFGNGTDAYNQAGYKCGRDAARNNASDLLAKPCIRARVKELRSAIEDQLQIDQLWIAQNRKRIAEDGSAYKADRLAALRDLEKALGYVAPDTSNVTHSGVVEHRWTVDDLRAPPKAIPK